jgi:hypothetical protein
MLSSRNTAFWILVVVLVALLFASNVPSPLYVVYQQEWDFSAITLTGIFAVYALIGLAALALTLSGRLDDVTARERIPSAVPVGAHAEGSRG